MVLLGIGAGLAFPALMTLAMSGATPSDAGLASGLVNTTDQVGGAIGLAVLATLATERTDALRADGASHGVGAQLRLPPRLPDRRGAGRRARSWWPLTVIRSEAPGRREPGPRPTAQAEYAEAEAEAA